MKKHVEVALWVAMEDGRCFVRLSPSPISRWGGERMDIHVIEVSPVTIIPTPCAYD